MKIKQKRILLIIALIVFTAVIITGVTFAWFVNYRSSMIVVVGDAKIDVEGWYDLVSDVSERDFTDEKKLSDFDQNVFEDVSSSQFIAYKFRVTNLSTRDATLSMRLSNMFDNMFDSLKDFVDSGGDGDLIDTELYTVAERNNSRLAFVLDNIYYEYEDRFGNVTYRSDQLNPVGENLYLWKYSRGEKFINTEGDSIRPEVPSVPLPGIKKVNGQDTKTFVNVYLMLTNRMSTTSIEEYQTWLTGDSSKSIIGVGQEYAANLLGYTWAKLTDGSLSGEAGNYAGYIDRYLAQFIADEIKSINPDGSDEGNKFYLNLDYFEFIGENVPEYG